MAGTTKRFLTLCVGGGIGPVGALGGIPHDDVRSSPYVCSLPRLHDRRTRLVRRLQHLPLLRLRSRSRLHAAHRPHGRRRGPPPSAPPPALPRQTPTLTVVLHGRARLRPAPAAENARRTTVRAFPLPRAVFIPVAWAFQRAQCQGRRCAPATSPPAFGHLLSARRRGDHTIDGFEHRPTSADRWSGPVARSAAFQTARCWLAVRSSRR